MNRIDFFKQQAKYLFKDYKTQKMDDEGIYDYEPKFFDINGMFVDYDWDEENFSLMKAQHFIAMMVGFEKWTTLLKATDAELELARLLFENRVNIEDWEMYITGVEGDLGMDIADESKLDLLKHMLENGGFPKYLQHYRLDEKQSGCL